MRPSLAILGLGFFFVACTDDAEPLDGGAVDIGFADTGVDSGPRDTGVDAAIDAGTDAEIQDAIADAGDSGFDVGADSGFDSGFDAGFDAGDGGPQADASECFDKQDCAPDGWCRETQTGEMACTPWSVEGDGCGGFTAPWALSRCNPADGVGCNTVQFIPDAPGVCSIAVTVAQLIATPGTYDGHVVALENIFPVAGPATCTPAAPCNAANACAVDLYVGDTVGASDVVGLQDMPGPNPIMCAGNECDYLTNCPQPIAMPAIVVGTFRAATNGIEVLYFNPGL